MASTQPPTVPDHRLLRLVGKGSYGEVWLARNAMGAWRAVKVVTRSDFESRRPFDREFEGIQRYEPLSRAGEGLVPILHVGLSPDGNNFYYVMELADGIKPLTAGAESAFDPADYTPRTLRSDLKEKGYLSIEDCVALGLSLVAGLNHLHKNGLIHRDVKPSNIVFIEGRAKLADLGLVGEIRRAQTFVGTEGYIPPEGPGHPAADLFALGKVLYEAATGFSPDEFPNPPSHWLNSPNQTPALELHEVILRACESDPAQRYRNAAEMQADLALLQSGQSVRRAHRLERRVKMFRAVGIAAVFTAILAVGLGFFALYRARIEGENLRQANKLLHRAENAEEKAREQLADAQLARAGLERLTGLAGHRARSLALLREAALYHTNKAELRSEVAAAMALLDIRQIPRGTKPDMNSGSADLWSIQTNSQVIKGAHNNLGWVDGSLNRYVRIHEDSSIRLHSWSDDRELVTLQGISQKGAILGPFSADGALLAGQSGDNAFVWDFATGRRVFSHSIPKLLGVDLTPDGKLVALWPPGQVLQLHQLSNGAETLKIDIGISDGQFWFSPDNRQLVALGGGGCEIQLFSTISGQPLGKYSLPPTACPRNVFWAPNGKGLFIIGNDFRGYFISMDAIDSRPLILEGHTSEIVGVAFHPRQPYLLTTCWDGFARIWDLSSGHCLIRFAGTGYGPRWTSEGHIGWNETTPSGRRFAEFQVLEPEFVRLLSEPVPNDNPDRNKGPWHGTFLTEGEAFATASYDGIRIWPSHGITEPLLLDVGQTRWLHFDSLNRQLWTSTYRGLFDWDIQMDKSSRTLHVGWRKARGEFSGEWALTAAPVINGVLTVSRRSVSLVKSNSTQIVGRLKRPASYLEASRDGKMILATDPRNVPEYAIALWQLEPWKELRDIPANGPSSALFTPDNQSIIISNSREIRRESRDDGHLEWRYTPATGKNMGLPLAISPDGQFVGFCTTPNEAALIDARNGELLIKFRPVQSGLISSLAFSHDSQRLAVTTQNHFSHIWDLAALRAHLATLSLDWNPSAEPLSKKQELPIKIALSGDTVAGSSNNSVPIRFSKYFTHFVDGFSSSSSKNTLEGLVPGKLVSKGITFDVYGIIQLGGASTEKNRPRLIKGIKVGRPAKRLHFLHATAWNGDDRSEVGRYTIHYANGNSETISVVDGRNIHDWWLKPGSEPTGVSIAWRGSNSSSQAAGFQTALYHMVWTNPYPNEVIQSIDLESVADRRVPFIAGITAELP